MFKKIGVRYQWYLIVRLIIVSAIPLMGVLTLIRGIQINILPHIIIFSLTFVMSVIFYFILWRNLRRPFYYYVQIIFDNILIFGILYFTGGTNSIFEIIYFVNILTGSFFLFANGGFLMATMSTIGYSLILFGEYFGFIISPYKIAPFREILLESLIIKAFIYVISFFLVAAISGFLSEKLQVRREEIARFRLQLKDIIEHIPQSIVILDEYFTVTDFNRKSREIFANIRYNGNFNEIDPELFPYIPRETSRRFVRGSKYYNLVSEKIRYKNTSDNFYIIIVNDITDIMEYENKLITKEKMEVIGELSASIAHEIRNPISNIKGSAKILMEESGDETKAHPMFKIIIEEVERLNDLVVDFLEFSKIKNINPELLNLKMVIEEIVKTNEKYLITDIREIPDNSNVFADKNKFKQVMINILDNSVESVKETNDPKIIISFSRNENYDIVKIADNGRGIDERIKSKMFQPFNSNRAGGTGLGLAIVYKIIKDEHKGDIEFQSEKGRTEFLLKFRRNIE